MWLLRKVLQISICSILIGLLLVSCSVAGEGDFVLPIEDFWGKGNPDLFENIISSSVATSVEVENPGVEGKDYLLFGNLDYEASQDAFVLRAVPNINRDLTFKIKVELSDEYDLFVESDVSLCNEGGCVLPINVQATLINQQSNRFTNSFFIEEYAVRMRYNIGFIIEFDANRPLLPEAQEKIGDFMTVTQENPSSGFEDVLVFVEAKTLSGGEFNLTGLTNHPSGDVSVQVNVPLDFNLVHRGQTYSPSSIAEIVIPDPSGVEAVVIQETFLLEERGNSSNSYYYDINAQFSDGQ